MENESPFKLTYPNAVWHGSNFGIKNDHCLTTEVAEWTLRSQSQF
jgi:hypothetical protein